MNSRLEYQGPIGNILLTLLVLLAICLVVVVLATCYLYDIGGCYRRFQALRGSPHGINYNYYTKLKGKEKHTQVPKTNQLFLNKFRDARSASGSGKGPPKLPVLGATDSKRKPKRRTPRPNSTLLLGLGRLTFSLKYSEESQLLHVNLISGRQMSLRNGELARMPFVKVNVNGKLETEKQSSPDDTPNPEFDEVLSFSIPSDILGEAILNFSIWDSDPNLFKILLGFIRVPMANFIDSLLKPAGTGPITREINENSPSDIPVRSNGEILFSLSYTSEEDKLVVAVLKCRDVVTKNDISELFVTVSLLVGGRKAAAKRTLSIQTFHEQVFNQILTFEPCVKQPNTTEDNISLVIALHAKALTDRESIVGTAAVGPGANEEGVSHWQGMISSARTAVAQWHRLVF